MISRCQHAGENQNPTASRAAASRALKTRHVVPPQKIRDVSKAVEAIREVASRAAANVFVKPILRLPPQKLCTKKGETL
jgi:hypothetical protein